MRSFRTRQESKPVWEGGEMSAMDAGYLLGHAIKVSR